ncbi:MAG TPA: hypothetical protein VL860_01760 [Planctomycetota bacterium]|nr:hypothetical protein [Planctomycetota bacterium]
MSNHGQTTPPPAQPEPTGNRKSLGILSELRKSLCQRMVAFVLQNERQLRAEITGRDTFNLMLGQMDEQFLSKLGVLDRAVYEINRGEQPPPAEQTTHFEVVEVRASREELPQKIANLLADHAEKNLIQLLPLRSTPEDAELLAVFSHTTTEAGGRASDS